jgi:hypothetical protein
MVLLLVWGVMVAAEVPHRVSETYSLLRAVAVDLRLSPGSLFQLETTELLEAAEAAVAVALQRRLMTPTATSMPTAVAGVVDNLVPLIHQAGLRQEEV